MAIGISLTKQGCNVMIEDLSSSLVYYVDRANLELIYSEQSDRIQVNIRGSQRFISEVISSGDYFFIENIAITTEADFYLNLKNLMAC